MSLRNRIAWLLLGVLGVMLVGLVVTWNGAHRMVEAFHLLRAGSIPTMQVMLELNAALQRAVATHNERHLLLVLREQAAPKKVPAPATLNAALEQRQNESEAAWRSIASRLNDWENLTRDFFPEKAGETAAMRQRLEALHNILVGFSNEESMEYILQRVNALENAQEQMQAEVVGMVARERAEVTARAAQHDHALRASIAILGFGGVLFAGAAWGFWLQLRRLALEPLHQLETAMAAFAQDDVEVPLPQQALGEIAVLTRIFAEMRAKWRHRRETQDQSLRLMEQGVQQKALMLLEEMAQRREAERELQLFQTTVEQAAEGLFWLTPTGEIPYANPAARRLMGWDAALPRLASPAELFHEGPEGDWEAVRQEIRTQDRVTRDLPPRRHEGALLAREAVLTLHPVDGMAYLMVAVRDITDRHQKEQEAQLSQAIFQYAPEGFLLTDGSGRILQANPAMSTLTGFSNQEMVGNNPRLYRSDRHDPLFYREIWKTIEATAGWRGEIWNRHKDGRIFPARVEIRAITTPRGGVHYLGIMSDISAHKEQEARLDHLVNHDVLTGLANRHQFTAVLERSVKNARRRGGKLALMRLDLDRFKAVNDTLGHPAGDHLLQQVGERVQGCLRESDLVARLGSDEFAVILENQHDWRDTVGVAEKIVASIAAPFTLRGQEVHVTCSLGVAFFPNDAGAPDDLTRKADAAAYFAKQQGGHRFFLFSAEMDRDLRARLRLEQRLIQSMEEGRFEIHYQPQINPTTGTLGGVEALLRWREEDNAPLREPSEFLAVAEESGLIIPLGEWVLRTACQQVVTWRNQGATLPRLSVNVSGRQFVRPDFPQVVAAILQQTEFPPQHLELELDESYLIRNLDTSLQTMTRLRDLGVRMTLDHFGSDYSFFSYLRMLPLNGLKLPREYATQGARSPYGASLCWSVLTLAEHLGMEVVVEGLEEAEEVSFFRGLSVDLIQGYYYARPMPAGQMASLLKASPDSTLPPEEA
ncbi:MAG: EAL domain-containing protein [Magnetococcales bacterium]|nr:EAL domain-containing protein [Magnetococcales bacterium]